VTITTNADRRKRRPRHGVATASHAPPVDPTSTAPSRVSHIGTPDQRVRVFVSSTLQELAPERVAAQTAIARLHLTPVMFELGARPHPPRELYRAYLAQSEVFVGIYWQQYGWVATGEQTSGLEDEYSLCQDQPKLMYVKRAAGREPRLTDLLERIEHDDRASYKPFDTAADLAELLAEDLAVLLTERFVRSAEPAVQSLDEPPLPVPPTPLIDRRTETALVGRLVRDPSVRLVTLVGPGGIGKTRVALEVARGWAEAPPDRPRSVWFVDLAMVRNPARWVESVADAVGIHPEGVRPVLEPIIDRLQGRTALIVLDNFEQVLDAATELSRFLAACPDLTVLVTSRSALHLRGEQEVRLLPLESPPAGADDVDLIGSFPAVQLVVARAAAVRPGFALTAANATAVAELARRLEGMPLAIELAAVQLRILTPSALLSRLGARLDRVLDLAAGPVDLPDRQQTLRATIEWSYELLDDGSRALLDRLSVFTGAWTLAAAEAVGTVQPSEHDVVDTLASLVAQSLVRVDESDPDEPRFRMLDVVRAYAAEQLTKRNDVNATVARLAHYLIDVVREVRGDLQGSAHRAAAERLDRERDEIRSAIDWAIAVDDAETVGWLITPLLTYWWSRGLLPMIHDLADHAAALPSAAALAPYGAALLHGAQGMGMAVVGRTAEAQPLLESTLSTATELGNARLSAYALLGLGWALEDRDPAAAALRLNDAVSAFQATGDSWGLAMALSNRGQVALVAGEPDVAHTMHEQALAAAETVDNDYLRAQVFDMLGLDAAAAGDLPGARKHYSAAADLHIHLLDYEGSAYCLSGLAGVALDQHRPAISARLIGASDYARRIVGAAVWPGMGSVNQARHDSIRAALTPSSFATAFAEGARMRIPDALNYAVAATADNPATDPFETWVGRLRPAT
jgi:predicted ATPase